MENTLYEQIEKMQELIDKKGGGIVLVYFTNDINVALQEQVPTEKQGTFINAAVARALKIGDKKRLNKHIKKAKK